MFFSGTLTPEQLGQISFFAGPGTQSLGTARFLDGGNGELVAVPEPSTWLTLAAGLTVLAAKRRRCP